jgi:hypothetical protein
MPVDIGDISSELIKILNDNLTVGYIVDRNNKTNASPNTAAKGKGYIGVFDVGPTSYEFHTIARGGNAFNAVIEFRIEYHLARMRKPSIGRDEFNDNLKEILTILTDPDNWNLNNKVNRGLEQFIDIEYEELEEKGIPFYHKAIITIRYEKRTS